MNQEKYPKRKNIRLKHYNYSSNGFYFVTICSKYHIHHIKLNKVIIKNILNKLTAEIPGLAVDCFVVMPDHLHIIFIFDHISIPLSEVVRRFKAVVTKKINIKQFWQRNYYEHVIRHEKALAKIREYILNNPDKTNYDFKMFYR